jgi:riboflavin biosynthesis pyrimidine reductase
VLVEGGGRTVSAFVEAACVDRLYLTSVPVLLGGGVPGIRLSAAHGVADAPRPPWRRRVLGADLCTELVLSRVGS